MSKDMDEQHKLAHKVVDVVHGPYSEICVTLLHYNVVSLENSNVEVRFFARKKVDQKLQRIVYKKYKHAEFIYLLVVMSSVCDNVITNKPVCNI